MPGSGARLGLGWQPLPTRKLNMEPVDPYKQTYSQGAPIPERFRLYGEEQTIEHVTKIDKGIKFDQRHSQGCAGQP